VLCLSKIKWRSPEEYYDLGLNQQVDVYSLGNNMYALLTGLWVFYDTDDHKTVTKRVKAGKKPYIDPRYKERSLADAKLAEIIDKCHSYYAKDRPSIFEIVIFLRDALKEARESDKH
jgi:serine/threonine protein kinase